MALSNKMPVEDTDVRVDIKLGQITEPKLTKTNIKKWQICPV